MCLPDTQPKSLPLFVLFPGSKPCYCMPVNIVVADSRLCQRFHYEAQLQKYFWKWTYSLPGKCVLILHVVFQVWARHLQPAFIYLFLFMATWQNITALR